MNKSLTAVTTALLASSSLLGACATTPWAGYSKAELAQTALIGDEDCAYQDTTLPNGKVMSAGTCKAGSNVNPERKVRRLAYDTATGYSVTCSIDVGEQAQNMLFSSAYQAGAYSVAGAVGVGGGATFVTKVTKGYPGYGAASDGASGAVAGSISGAYSAAGGKGDCVKQKMERVQGEFPEAIVVTLVGGKAFDANSRIRVADTPVVATH